MKKISTGRNVISFLNINSFRKMKLILLLISFCFFQLYAVSTYAQNTKISLELSGVKLREAIKTIEEKTPFVFFYNNSDIDMNRQVSLNAKDASIKDVLNQLLSSNNYRIENYKIVLLADKPQQEGKITGKVLDETGLPIIGANVIDKKTNSGTITDLDGKFTIDAPQNAVLTVSFIGYISQEIHLKGQKELTVTLKEDSQLIDEVVVVGFGTQKKVNLTGAVASVNLSETLGDRPIANVTAALQGTTPGLQIGSETGTPGDAMSYNIRGTTSINGGTPLVLVNNVPMDINMIDPQEIESVSILKDAASAAIYGARAAFGVILITTKQGKKDSAPKFNYNNNISFSKALELPQKASPLESVLAYKEMGWPNDTYVDGKNITQWEGYIRDYMSDPGKYPKGYIFDEKGNLFLMKERNMFDDMTDNFGFMQNHSMSVSGGSEKTVYRIGVGYTGEDGILITDKDSYDRLNLSTFMGVDVNSWLTTQLDLKYGNSKQNKVEAGGRNTVWVAAMNLPSYQNNEDYEQDGITYAPESPATYIRYGEPRKIKQNDLRVLGRVILTPLKGLRITGEYTYNRTSSQNKFYKNKYQYIGLNFTGVLNSTENSSYAVTSKYTDYNAVNLFANYDMTFGKHDISLMGGYNQESSHTESQYSYRTDVVVGSLPSLSLSTGTPITSDAFEEFAIRGLFYRVNYSYAGKYLFEANGRYDGTSRFPKNSRFGFFPSFSAGWRVSEESFMQGMNSYLSNLKLRASWGSIGNQVILKSDNTPDNYPYIPDMNVYLSSWLVDGQKITTLGAPAMVSSSFGWEKVYTLDFGFDLDLFDNKLNTTFDWYRRDTKGMLAPGMELPGVVGASAAKQNAADLKTYGWELKINWRDQIGQVGYRAGFNLYDSQSEITKYDNEAGLIGSNIYRKGMKLGEIWGYVTDRFYTEDDFNTDGTLKPGIPMFKGAGKVYPGDILYKNFDEDTEYIFQGENTVYNPGDQRIIGNNTPRYQYGITAGVTYKGFDLSIFLRGVGKRDYWRTDQMAWPTGGWGSLFKETLDFWTPENTDAYFPRVYSQDQTNTSFNRKVQTKYLANAAYLKIQNITLSYTLPKSFCQRIYMDNIRVFVSGENLHTWDHLPEGLESDMLSKGAWEYPFMKKYSLGINVTF